MRRRVVPLALPRVSPQRSPVTPKRPNHAVCFALGGSGCLCLSAGSRGGSRHLQSGAASLPLAAGAGSLLSVPAFPHHLG